MSQLIIGDIGSTTGSWIILEGGKARQFNTTGYNPSLHDESVVMRMLAQLKTASHTPELIIYYGTGVTGEKKAGEVGNVIAAEFPNAATEVHSDMLGAARATCQHGRGIVAILGTGSHCRF